jgi:phage gp16-like protein
MPIINLQRKLTEVGRIRLGASSDKGAPTKLDKFRLTSKSREALDAAAEVYGGTVTAWKSPDGDAFELVTNVSVLDVVVPPGNALSQWYELWSGAGCQRRCDGETETLSNTPCKCPTDQQVRSEMSGKGQACKPTTRLSVILPKIKTVGIWRLETHGYNAATELAGIAELLEKVSANNGYLPATLRLEQRSARRAGKLSRFAVPVLEVGATVQEAIAASAGQTAPAIEYQRPVAKTLPQVVMPEPEFEEEEAPTIIEPKVIEVVAEPELIGDELDGTITRVKAIKENADSWPEDYDPSNPYDLAPEATPVDPITTRKPLNQVQRIQILKRELGLTDEQYRAGLAKYNVNSSKDLTPEQAAEVIAKLTSAISARKSGNE